jgi:hypothetical protein
VPEKKSEYPSQNRPQVVFRVDEADLIAFKMKLLEAGNVKVQACMEGIVKKIISGKIKV